MLYINSAYRHCRHFLSKFYKDCIYVDMAIETYTGTVVDITYIPCRLQSAGITRIYRLSASAQSLSLVLLSQTPQTAAHQALLSLGFSRQEGWCGLPFPSPGDLPDPGTELRFPVLQSDSLPLELPRTPSIYYRRI